MARGTDRARRQPDDHGRAVDGDHRRADRRARPRQDRLQGAADARRRHGVQRGPRDRGARDRARPRHHRRGRAGRRDARAVAAASTGARQVLLAAGGVVTVVCVYLSYTYVWASTFPSSRHRVGSAIIARSPTRSRPGRRRTFPHHRRVQGRRHQGRAGPVEALLVQSPWWLTTAAVLALAALLGGWRAAITGGDLPGAADRAPGCGPTRWPRWPRPWSRRSIVMVLGVVVGVWMGRSARADRVIRPVLDAAQVMPAFVYLVPFLALFAASRFTAIVGRGRVRRTGRHQDRRRRHPGGPRRHRRGGDVGRVEHVAAHHEGAAADGARRARPWRPTRA